MARAPKGVVTFVELPAGAGHGWDTVLMPGDPSTPSPFAEQLESFLSGRSASDRSGGAGHTPTPAGWSGS